VEAAISLAYTQVLNRGGRRCAVRSIGC